ncbi:MAG: putative Ig domain-containing protein [Planctomycetes bacterium]|nr:putative Ig domain-containing protein [Planctomycetota bacterium]
MNRLTVVILIALFASAANATERYVPAEHATIQDAINASVAGDIIHVSAGTYVGAVNIDRGVRIWGAGQSLAGTVIEGTVTVTGSGAAAGYPLEVRNLRIQPTATGNGILFNAAASNILFRDVTSTTAAGNSGHYAIHIQTTAVLNNLIFEGCTASYSLAGMRTSTTGSVNGLTIRNCDFSQNVFGMLIFANNGTPDNAPTFNNVRIYKSTFNNNKDKGIYLEKINNGTISQCTFDTSGVAAGHWSTYTDPGSVWAAGLDLNLKFGDYQNFKLVGNVFNNCGSNGDMDKATGAVLKARDDGGTYGPHPASLAGITVQGNVFTNNSFVDLRFGEPNKLNAGMSGAVVRANSFSGSPTNTAVDNHATLAIDATGNYWDAADGSSANGGSGQGVNVIVGAGAVDSTGHLTSGDNNAGKLGLQITRYVDDDWAALPMGSDPDGAGPATAMGFDAFGAIGDAANAASPGDLISVANGNYAQFQTLIATDAITIQGESQAGVVLIPAVVDSKDQDPTAGTIVLGLIIGADEITVSNITIDGEGNNTALAEPADANNFRVGIVNNPQVLSHGTTVSNCVIRGCVFDGMAIGTFNPMLGRSLGIMLDNNSISDVMFAHGISACGEGTVSNNTIDNVGYQALASGLRGTGVQLEAGPITVSNNTITNFTNLGIGNNASNFPAPHRYVMQGNSISQMQNGNFAQGDFGIRIVGADSGSMIGGSGAGQGNTIDLTANDTSIRRWGIALHSAADELVGDVSIIGNTITMAGEGTGILFHSCNRSSNPVITSDNTISSSNPTNMGGWQGVGILVNDDGDMYFDGYDGDGENYVSLDGNDVSGFVVGISANRVGTDTVGGRVTSITMSGNNRVFNNNIGLQVLDADGSTNAYRATVTINVSGLEAYQNATGVLVDGGQLAADQISARDNTMLGVSIVNDGQVTQLEDSVLSGNPTGLHITSTAMQAAMPRNDYSSSSNFGVNNLSGVVLSSLNSFWGDASGPMHASNPTGTGVPVSDDVNFFPFDGFDPVEPSITTTPSTMVDVLSPYSYIIAFTGDPLPTLSVSGLPAWLSFDAMTQTISGTPQLGDAGTTGTIEVRASSGFGPDAIQEFEIEVVAIAPAITSTAPTAATVSQMLSYQITATGTPAPTISVMGLPNWLGFDPLTNTIAGTPTANDLGMTGMIAVTAANAVMPDATQTFQINVVGQAPTILSAPSQLAIAGSEYSYTIVALGTPAPTLMVTGLPAWLSFDAMTNVISGTPGATDGGVTGMITVTASNGVAPDAVQNFTISVQATAPAVISLPPAAGAIIGEEWEYIINATGFPTPTMTVMGLPSWLAFDGGNRIFGTPTVGHGHTATITITLSNGVGMDTIQTLTVTVIDPNHEEDDNFFSCSLSKKGSSSVLALFVLMLGALLVRRRRRLASMRQGG